MATSPSSYSTSQPPLRNSHSISGAEGTSMQAMDKSNPPLSTGHSTGTAGEGMKGITVPRELKTGISVSHSPMTSPAAK